MKLQTEQVHSLTNEHGCIASAYFLHQVWLYSTIQARQVYPSDVGYEVDTLIVSTSEIFIRMLMKRQVW